LLGRNASPAEPIPSAVTNEHFFARSNGPSSDRRKVRAAFQWQLRCVSTACGQPAVRSDVNITGACLRAAAFAISAACAALFAAQGVVNAQASAVVAEVAAVGGVGGKTWVSH